MRVSIFFDGKNFYSGWRDRAEGRKIDFAKLSRWLVRRVGGSHLWGVYYYTSVETGAGPDGEAQRNLAGFLDMLQRQPGYFVKRFARRTHTSTCSHCGTESRFSQDKEVDTTMVADMLRLAAVGAFDIMVLVSGDADYAPAVEGARALGRQAYVATWAGTGLSHRIRKVAFDHIDLLEGLESFAAEPPPGEGDEGDGASVEEGLLAGDDDETRTFVRELRRAAAKFTGSYVGLSYFVTRWRSNSLDAAPETRRRILDQLIDGGRIEVYDAPDGNKAIRLVEGAEAGRGGG